MVNTGGAVVSDVQVQLDVVDASGLRSSTQVNVCPSRLEPGQVGTWEAFPVEGLTPRVRAENIQVRWNDYDSPLEDRDLSVELMERNDTHRYVAIGVTNKSLVNDYVGVVVCDLPPEN